MRLLSSTKMELEEFPDDGIPEYAILSHRWQDDEVSFQDMPNATAIRKRGAYAKLKMCCEQADKDGLQYVWVDTCCIDKTSSAELSESINSMYRWYQNAAVCYAYLFDVDSTISPSDLSFRKSVWFSRGWTLQELIAPSKLVFYDSMWHEIGTKESMQDAISEVTGIDVDLLKGADPESFSIAKRMSWASERVTTRVEDIAYSLLGLFGIYMPMLYGEGERAFVRLQEEIIKQSNDQSIFAWSNTDHNYRGLLARAPSDFRKCRNINPSKEKLTRIPYSITNMGFSMELLMIPWAMETYLAALDCEVENVSDSRIGIFLQLLPEKDQYARVLLEGSDIQTFDPKLVPQSQYSKVYVKQKILIPRPSMDRLYGFKIRKFEMGGTGPDERIGFVKAICWNQWNNEERILKIPVGSRGTAGILWFRTKYQYETLEIGFDPLYNPVCSYGIAPNSGPKNSVEAQMKSRWMDRDSNPKGDRLNGLDGGGHFYQVRIVEEVIDNQRMWVVEVEHKISQLNRLLVTCDGCQAKIDGVRFKCVDCPNFDYCSKCILTAGNTHPTHTFQNMNLQWPDDWQKSS